VALFLDRALLATLFPLVYICDLPPSCQLGWNLTLECGGEFVCDNNIFTPLASAITSLEMICALQTLHLLDLNSHV
jgi:hypothetical protein